MNKTDLIERLAQREDLGLTKKQSKEILNAVIEEIQDGLAEDKIVRLTGFGTWKSRYVEAREAKNPRDTSKTIQIPASHRISFAAGAVFKNVVNGITPETKKPAAKKVVIKK